MFLIENSKEYIIKSFYSLISLMYFAGIISVELPTENKKLFLS